MLITPSIIAWFQARQNAATSNDGFTIDSFSGKLKTITFHKLVNGATSYQDFRFDFNKTPFATITYNYKTNDEQEISYDFDNGLTEDDKIGENYQQEFKTHTMGKYDILDDQAALLIFFHLKSDEEYNYNETEKNKVRLTIPDTTTYLANVDANYQPVNEISTEGLNPLSSVVNINLNGFTEAEFTTFSSGSYFSISQSNNHVSNFGTANTFFSTADIGADKNTISMPNKEISTSDEVSTRNHRHLAALITYNEDSIDLIYNRFIGNSILEDQLDYVINYSCDWTFVV